MSPRDTMRFDWLEELRGVACLAVLLHHASYVFSEKVALTHPGFHHLWFNQVMTRIDFGVWGVFLFFLISGIVIPASVDKASNSVGTFILHRFLRIYPLYFVSILLAAWIWHKNALDVLANMTVFPKLLGRSEALGVYWSLQVEVIFYGVVALGIRLGWKKTGVFPYVFFMGALFLTVVLAYYRYLIPNLPVSPALGLLCIAAGFIYYHNNLAHTGNATKSPGALAFLCGLLIICLAYYSRGSRYTDTIAYTCSVALALAVIQHYPLLRRYGHARLRQGLRWAGMVSFSIYLIHQPLLEIGRRLNWWGLPTELALPLAIAVILLGAYFSYRVFELPFINLYRRGARMSRVRTPAGSDTRC